MTNEMIELYQQVKLGEGRFDTTSERLGYIDGFLAAEEFFANKEVRVLLDSPVHVMTEGDLARLAKVDGHVFLDYYARFGAGLKLEKKEFKKLLTKYQYKQFKQIREVFKIGQR